MGDYEAAFSDDEEEAESKEQGSKETASVCDVVASSMEKTCDTTETYDTYDKKEQEQTSESTSGDSGSESSRPLSPGPVSTQYYYFYQGIILLTENNKGVQTYLRFVHEVEHKKRSSTSLNHGSISVFVDYFLVSFLFFWLSVAKHTVKMGIFLYWC